MMQKNYVRSNHSVVYACNTRLVYINKYTAFILNSISTKT